MIDKIIEGAKLISALSGNPEMPTEAEAVADSLKPKKSYELNISDEVNVYSNSTGTNFNYNRTNIKLDNLSFTYDKKNHGAKDLAQIAVTDPFRVPIGTLAFLQKGNPGEQKQYIWEATKVFSRKNKDGSVVLDVGQFLKSGKNPTEGWVYLFAENPKLTGMASILGPMKGEKATGISNTYFGILGVNPRKIYASIAGTKNKENTRKIGLLATTGMKDFAALGINVADSGSDGNKSSFYKTKLAIGDVNQDFFNKGIYDFASGLFTFGPFFPPHFSPTCTKGDFTVGVDGSKIHDKETRETLVGLRTKYGAFSAGTYMEKQKGEDKKRNAVIGYHKGWKIGNKNNPLNISVELKYDKNRELSGHITTSKSMKFPRRK